MPRIDPAFYDCVVYLYKSIGEAESGTMAGTEGAPDGGSGFLVARRTPTPELGVHVYAVTAAHVIRGGCTVIRAIGRRRETVILETEPEDWEPHPFGDDVAVCPIPSDKVRWGIYSRSEHVPFVEPRWASESTLSQRLSPGDEVFWLGRFVGFDGKEINRPALRFGTISMMPAPIRHPGGFDQESFLVEAHSIPGFSGSPVFLYRPRLPEDAERALENLNRRGRSGEFYRSILRREGPWLLGLDWGHLPDALPVRNRQGEALEERLYVGGNSGFMAVLPSWKISEILDH